eukprot:GILK01003546.1.p1 GENE.GILK01003546.1~~GILK01003546.1.p1  ORF type:complete len:312 (-),score=35.40 GILK01003546.1:194-1129(-)
MEFVQIGTSGVAPAGRGGCAHTVLHDKIYYFGGANRSGMLNDIHELTVDETTGSWTNIAAVGEVPKLSGATAVTYGDLIVVFGGKDYERDLDFNEVHTFHPGDNKWERGVAKGREPKPRNSHSAVLHQQRMIVFGGANSSGPMEDVQSLNLESMEWTPVQVQDHMPAAREMHTANVYDSKMYVFGGRRIGGITNELFLLHLDTMSWKLVSKAPFARCAHGASVWNNKLFIFGGTNGQRFFNDVQVYDFQYEDWTTPVLSAYVPLERIAPATVLLGSRMIIFGGSHMEKDLNEVDAVDLEKHSVQRAIEEIQ